MTPISSPRFSNGNTCSTPGSADSAAVRSAHASITVRTRETGSDPNAALWSLVKHTTSQRPTAGRCGHSGLSSTSDATAAADWANDGKRFSNTTTS